MNGQSLFRLIPIKPEKYERFVMQHRRLLRFCSRRRCVVDCIPLQGVLLAEYSQIFEECGDQFMSYS